MVITADALRAHADWVARGSQGDGRMTLRGDDARGQDLRSAQLSGAILEDCKLEAAQLGGTTWASATVIRTSFREAVFDDARLDDARFVDCDFRDADFSDLDRRARGSTVRCRFERCDLRGSIWLERSVAGASFVDCQFDLIVGAPRDLSNVELVRPRLTTADGTVREVAAADVLTPWQSGKLLVRQNDDDRAYVRRGLQGRWRKHEAYLARGPRPSAATGVGSIADKWSEPLLPDVAPNPQASAPLREPVAPVAPPVAPPLGAVAAAREPITLPPGSSPDASAWRAANGVTVYRDSRSGFGMLLLPPVFLPPDDQSDLIVGVANTIILRVVHLPRAAGPMSADEEAGALIRKLLDVEPLFAAPGWPGVESMALGSVTRDEYVRDIAVIVGGDGVTSGKVVLTLDYNLDEVDVATALAVWSAHVSAVWFSSEPREIPELIPASVWWDAGFPLRLAASRPALPAIPGLEEHAGRLLGATDVLPPTLKVTDAQRLDIAGQLARVGVANALEIAGAVATVHDYRGLAFALLEADLAYAGASAAAPPVVASAAPPSPFEPSSPGSWLAQPMPLPPPPTMPAPARTAGPAPVPAARRVVTITAAEAARSGLPAVGMTVDLGGTSLMDPARPNGRRYLLAGGPPGGALGFEVWASDETADDTTAIHRAVAAHYPMSELPRGLTGTLTIAGASRPALTFLEAHNAHDPTHYCATLVPHARGAVLVVLSLSHPGHAPVACDRLASYPDLAKAVATFSLIAP